MKYYLFFLLLLWTSTARAQEIELNPITVSASLSQTQLSETGRHITIIKGEDFKNLPVHSLDELLRYVPGIELQARGPMGAQGDIVLRGSTFQQVLIILDGMRINDPNTGHFNSYIPIAPAEIERIEILKGASSAIYGADAVGGVINVITKSFAARQGEQKTNIVAGTGVGEYGLIQGNAGFYLNREKMALSGGLITNNARGIQQRGITGYFYNTTASLSANYRFNEKWNLAYRLAFDNRDFAAQNFYTTYVFDTASEKVSSWWNQVRLSRQTQKQNIILNAGYKRVNDEYKFSPETTANSNKSDLFQLSGQFHRKLTGNTTMVTGVNYQQKGISSNDRGNHHLFTVSPFVSLTQKAGQNMTIRPSLQVVFFKNSDAEFVPQLDLVRKLGQVRLRASAGKTIREADFTERYNNFNKPLVKSGSIGNPDLKAERSFSYEAGADWFLKDYLKLSGSFFQRFQRRVIDYSTTNFADMPRKDNLVPDGIYALAKNIAELNTTGVEIEAQFSKKMQGDQQLMGNVGMVWLDSHSSDATPSFYISSHAKFLTNFSAMYRFGAFMLSLNGMYKLRNRQEASDIHAVITRDYFLLNTRAGYSFFNRSFLVYVEVDNVFNKQFSDLLGSVMPGRWLSGGIQYQFDR